MGTTDRITVWGCLCIMPWREEGLQPSPWHAAVLPLAPVKACRITLSSTQEQPVLQIRDSIPGSLVGFFIQTSWESTSHLDMILREGWLVPSPLALNRASHPVTSIQSNPGKAGLWEGCPCMKLHCLSWEAQGSCNPAHPQPSQHSCYTPTSLMKHDFKSPLSSEQQICHLVWQSNL